MDSTHGPVRDVRKAGPCVRTGAPSTFQRCMSTDRNSSPPKPPAPQQNSAPAKESSLGQGPQRARAGDRIPVAARCSVLGDAFAIVFRPGRGEGKRWLACDTYALTATPADAGNPPPPPRRIRLIGEILLDGGYPGCPYCRGNSFLLCSTCRGYVCTGAAKVTGDDLTYCPTCDSRIRVGKGGGLRDAEAMTAPPASGGRSREQITDSGRVSLPSATSGMVRRTSRES
jgi:hypothetical protein